MNRYGWKGRPPTKSEERHLQKVRETGCIVCQQSGIHTPGVPHHLDGRTKPDCHYLTINLCLNHHQQKDNNTPQQWVSRHGDGRRAFEIAYGAETDLLMKTKELISET